NAAGAETGPGPRRPRPWLGTPPRLPRTRRATGAHADAFQTGAGDGVACDILHLLRAMPRSCRRRLPEQGPALTKASVRATAAAGSLADQRPADIGDLTAAP